MYAYSDLYIEKAQLTLGCMLDYAVYDLKMNVDDFYKMFLHTGIADAFGSGDPKYTVGMSGAELAGEVLHEITGTYPDVKPGYRFDRTPEYRAGWALAYYEWYSSIPFARIEEAVPVGEIVEMYHPYHEADLTKFTDAIDEAIAARQYVSRLARLRAYAGLSQKALAEDSGVSVRMIEQYEQGKKDINRASSITVCRLARSLHCKMEDLISTI